MATEGEGTWHCRSDGLFSFLFFPLFSFPPFCFSLFFFANTHTVCIVNYGSHWGCIRGGEEKEDVRVYRVLYVHVFVCHADHDAYQSLTAMHPWGLCFEEKPQILILHIIFLPITARPLLRCDAVRGRGSSVRREP